MSEPRPRFFKNAAYALAGRGALLVAGFILSPVILAELGSEGFAAWALAFSLGQHFVAFLELGIIMALIHRLSVARAEGDPGLVRRALRAHFIAAGAALALGLGLFLICGGLIGEGLGFGSAYRWGGEDAGVELLLLAVVGALCRPASQAWDCVLQGFERFDHVGRMSLLRALLWIGLVLAALALGGGPRAIIGCEIALQAILTLPGWLLARSCLRRFAEEHRGGESSQASVWDELRALLRFGWGIYRISILELLNTQTDKLLLGIRAIPGGVKSYELGQKVALPGRYALGLLGQIFFPAVPALAREGPEALGAALARAQRVVVLISAAALLGLAACAPSFLAAWLGAQRVDEAMVLALRALAIAYALDLLAAVPLQFARGLNQMAIEIRTAVAFGLVGFLARLAGLYAAGITGLLIVGAAAYAGLAGARLLLYRRSLAAQASGFWSSTFKPVAAAGVGAAAAVAVELLGPLLLGAPAAEGRADALLRLALSGLAFALAWLGAAAALGLLGEARALLRRALAGSAPA